MSEPVNNSPANAQAAAAARKARRKKTRWGADKETAQENDAQAGSTAVATPVVTATVPPQQEVANLKLNSVPSGTPLSGQPASISASGQPVSATFAANSQSATAQATSAYPWSKGAATPAAGDTQDSANEVLPGPPPKPSVQPATPQPWFPGAPHTSIPGSVASAPPTAQFSPYGAEQHFFQYPTPGSFPMPGMQSAAPADDDRPPGVDDADDAPPGAETIDIPAVAAAVTADPNAGPAAALPGPPAAAVLPTTTDSSEFVIPAAVHHPHDATAPPSFPASYPQAGTPYSQPQPYPQHPQAHYLPQYAMPQPEAEDDSEPLPPGAEDEPQAPGTEGDNPAVAYGDGYTDPAYAYAQQAGYGTYTDPQTGYTYPYDPQQYGYDPSYYAYAGYGQYSTAEAAAEAASEAPAAPPGEPGPPTGSPTKAAASGKPKVTSVVQVKLPKQYYEKLQAKKREEEERAKQDLLRKTAEADARRQEAANAAAERAKRAEELANGHDQAEIQFKEMEPEDQLLAASTPAEVRAAKKAMAAKEAAKAKAAAEQAAAERAAATMAKQPLHEVQEKEPSHKERKRRTKSRWRDDDQEAEIAVKASKRRRASPQVFDRSKVPHPSSPSLSPLRGPPPPRRMSPRRRPAPMREPSPERPKSRRPRGYRMRRSLSVEAVDAVQRYSPQPVQEYEPQPLPKPEPTEEEKAAEAQAAVAARETTPEPSEEGEIPVDAEELEVISKAQEKAAAKPTPPRSPVRKEAAVRDHDRLPDRDRGTPRGRDRPSGGRGGGNERKRGRGRGNQRNMDHRDSRNSYDRRSGGRESYMGRPPPGLMPPVYGQYVQQEQQYDDGDYEEYGEEASAYDSSVYQPASYDAPYGVYGSAMGSAMIGKTPYGQYGSYG